jgi:ABC-type sugar transport system ATPase subunit
LCPAGSPVDCGGSRVDTCAAQYIVDEMQVGPDSRTGPNTVPIYETESLVENAVVITDLVKVYGRTRALKGVSMSIEAGTVNALVGENGAGKSTALGVLAGRVPPTGGKVEVFGEELRYGDPRFSRRAGVVAIYQELTIVPALTVEANVFLAGPLSSAGFLSEREMRARYIELCDRIGVRAHPPRTLARELSVADQQILEILRALVSDARIILFDEPTASLAVPEREALFRLIRTLRADGVTIVLVSHNLDEVLDIADVVTVFRDGLLTVSEDRANFTKAILVEAMIGKAGDSRIKAELLEEVGETAPAAAATTPVRVRRSRGGTPVLSASEITTPGVVTDLSIEVHAGEVVGVGGLVGSGRTSLLRALAGLTPTSTGRMWIDGNEVAWPRTVRRALQYGIALVPEDRKSQGLVMPMSVMDNIALSNFRGVARRGLLSPREVERVTAEMGESFGLSRSRLRDPAWVLSGGNQQKLLLARWKHLTPRILLCDEPTRGIDVGAKAEILRSLEAMADDGLGIVIVSSELEEVVTVADRVVVLSEGEQVGTLDSEGGDITTADVLNLAFRVQEAV